MNWWLRFKKSQAHTQANIVCTALITIATIAYSFIAARQLAKMRDQLNILSDTFQEMQKQTLTFQESADAAQQQASLNRQQLIGTLGAVVNFDINIQDLPTPELTISWMNIGHMNAKNFQIAHIDIDKIALPSQHEIHRLRDIPLLHEELIAPNQQPQWASKSYPFSLSNADADALQKGKIGLRAEGFGSYEDGSGTAIATGFCKVLFYWEVDQIRHDGTLMPTTHHNPIDCNDVRSTFESAQDWNANQHKKAKVQ